MSFYFLTWSVERVNIMHSSDYLPSGRVAQCQLQIPPPEHRSQHMAVYCCGILHVPWAQISCSLLFYSSPPYKVCVYPLNIGWHLICVSRLSPLLSEEDRISVVLCAHKCIWGLLAYDLNYEAEALIVIYGHENHKSMSHLHCRTNFKATCMYK